MKTARGFTLLEVLIAGAILTIVMIGTMPLIAYAIRRGSDGRQITVAQQLAGEILEGLRNEVRYDPAASSAGNATFDSAWSAAVLPHAIQTGAGTPAPAAGGVDCQAGDGVVFHYGPYPFAREGNTFYACYALRSAAATDPRGNTRLGVPAGAAEAIVRVLWRNATGSWSSWSVGDLLHPGA